MTLQRVHDLLDGSSAAAATRLGGNSLRASSLFIVLVPLGWLCMTPMWTKPRLANRYDK